MDFLEKYPFFFHPNVVATQIAGFLVFFFLMKTFLFDRMLRFLSERDRRLDQAAERIAVAREEVERRARLHAEVMAQADKAAYEAMQEVIRKGQQERARLIATAHEAARQELQNAKAALEDEKQAALASLDRDVATLSGQIVRAVTS